MPVGALWRKGKIEKKSINRYCYGLPELWLLPLLKNKGFEVKFPSEHSVALPGSVAERDLWTQPNL